MGSILNTKLCDWLRYDRLFPTIDYMGLEAELEYTEVLGMPRNPKLWNIIGDASLRNGFELTTKPGFRVGDIDKYLDDFKKYVDCFNLQHSIRTSFHVHVNATCLTLEEIYAVLAAFWLLEDYLVELNGVERKGNLHCLRLGDADNLRDIVLREIRTKQFFRTWRQEDRYAAQNLHALSKFGTVEYRFIRGLHEPDLMKMWVINLHNMVEAAVGLGSVRNVLDILHTLNISAFIDYFFLEPFSTLVKKIAFESASVDNNYHFIYEISKALENVSRSKLRFSLDEDLEVDKKKPENIGVNLAAPPRRPRRPAVPDWFGPDPEPEQGDRLRGAELRFQDELRRIQARLAENGPDIAREPLEIVDHDVEEF